MRLIDTHVHLSASDFKSDLNEVIERARNSGVEYMITIGSGYGAENYDEAISISESYNLFFATGVHPHDADLGLKDRWNVEDYRSRLEGIVEDIKRISSNRRMVGIGEIGLDFYYDLSPRDVQKSTFLRFLQLSTEVRKPVIIHSRDSFGETIGILRDFSGSVPIRGVFHCFSGDVEQAGQVLDMGFYISIPGIVTFKRAETMREVARYIPEDRLLIETDAPFLAPVPYRGKRNEPSYIVETYKMVADIRNVSIDSLAESVIRNSFMCFDIRED